MLALLNRNMQEATMQRKLYRSRNDSRIAGVCGGLGEYLDIDPTLVRLIFVLLALTGGHGVLLYIILWLIVPYSTQPLVPQAPRGDVTPGTL
jgi:phage shock protein C